MPWVNVMNPALMNPTTMTVVTELDWTRQVTRVPTPQALMRFSVTEAISLRSRSPAMACSPSDMFFMPSRKMPRPPITLKPMLTSTMELPAAMRSLSIG